ncbi:MAG TPA: hypothetical protein VLW85_07970, partial [Myxococcales bacterium]|nr:hypothetical protein [Myxococcales bacterium]
MTPAIRFETAATREPVSLVPHPSICCEMRAHTQRAPAPQIGRRGPAPERKKQRSAAPGRARPAAHFVGSWFGPQDASLQCREAHMAIRRANHGHRPVRFADLDTDVREQERRVAESSRVAAEKLRELAEDARTRAEMARKTAET